MSAKGFGVGGSIIPGLACGTGVGGSIIPGLACGTGAVNEFMLGNFSESFEPLGASEDRCFCFKDIRFLLNTLIHDNSGYV